MTLLIKKFAFLFTAILGITLSSMAQAPSVQLVPQFYGGGYNIKAYQGFDGKVNSQVIGGIAPYTYLWSNGATSANLINVVAGSYSVTITDAANQQSTASVILYGPDAITVSVRKSQMGDFNVSSQMPPMEESNFL